MYALTRGSRMCRASVCRSVWFAGAADPATPPKATTATAPATSVALAMTIVGRFIDAPLRSVGWRETTLRPPVRQEPAWAKSPFHNGASSRGCDGRFLARTQGVSVSVDTGATEDAARGRPARPGGSVLHCERGSVELVSAQRLAKAIAEARESWSVPGLAVGVLEAGAVISSADGMLELGRPEPVSPDTVFRIASITKPFTATLAMTLVQDGLLALDEPPPGTPVEATVRQLLSH